MIESESTFQRLIKQIQRADLEYYVRVDDAHPGTHLTDDEYDALKRQAFWLLEQHPEWDADEQVRNSVGFDPYLGDKDRHKALPLYFGDKYRHRVPMLSLGNAFDWDEVREFDGRLCRAGQLVDSPVYFAEPKIDGLSLSLTYRAGELALAATRGDGEQGDIVTGNAMGIAAIPQRLAEDAPNEIEIRGEVYMPETALLRLNRLQEEAGKPLYANVRNAATGSLRQKEAKVTAGRGLGFFAFAFGYVSPEFALPPTQLALSQLLERWGFQLCPHGRLLAGYADMQQWYDSIVALRPELDFAIDGVVYKANDLGLQARVGEVFNRPRWAIAHKFAEIQAETTLQAITVQVGRTGVLTPVAELEPVEVSGVTVSRATLHNGAEIERKDIRVGDTVRLQRAGGVIPQIVSVNFDRRPPESVPFRMPDACPACGGATIRRAEHHKGIMCGNGLRCPEQLKLWLVYMTSRGVLNIDNAGEKLIEHLIEWEWVREPADLFDLAQHREAWIARSGYEELSVDKVLQAFAALTPAPGEPSGTVALDKFILALGVPGIGETVARVLAQHFAAWANLRKWLKRILQGDIAAIQELMAIDGIGLSVVVMIHRYFHASPASNTAGDAGERLHAIDRFAKRVCPADFVVAVSGGMAGKTVVFTGTLQHMSRNVAKMRATQAGMVVVGSVSSKTDYAVIGEKAGSKAAKAEQLGVQTLTEEAFLELLESDGASALEEPKPPENAPQLFQEEAAEEATETPAVPSEKTIAFFGKFAATPSLRTMKAQAKQAGYVVLSSKEGLVANTYVIGDEAEDQEYLGAVLGKTVHDQSVAF